MLGLLLLYFIGKYFYALAELHQKHKWGFTILGIVAYYAGTALVGVFYALFIDTSDALELDSGTELAITLIAVPFGLAASYGCYKYLESRWSKAHVIESDGTLDQDFLSNKD